ncbi:MAG: hypothetical protein K1X86_08050 [Ignavibacteria bacterium]|nr:hypothetical protein [Ignavibacteria bacterium]
MGINLIKFKHEENLSEAEKFLSQNEMLVKELDKSYWAYNLIGSLIPQYIGKLGSGHYLPYSESMCEIRFSYELTRLAFYKQGFISLRNSLELGLLSVFFDRNDDAEKIIKEWHKSKSDTPFKKHIIKGIFDIENIKKFSLQVGLKEMINNVHEELSDYSHTKGYFFTTHHLNKANFTRFNEDSFLKWCDYFKRIVKILVLVHILKYPVALQNTPLYQKFGLNEPFGGFIDEGQAETLRSIFNFEELQILRKISDEDENAKQLAEWVNSRPNISEEELEKQFEEFDKFMDEMKPKKQD